MPGARIDLPARQPAAAVDLGGIGPPSPQCECDALPLCYRPIHINNSTAYKQQLQYSSLIKINTARKIRAVLRNINNNYARYFSRSSARSSLFSVKIFNLCSNSLIVSAKTKDSFSFLSR